MSEYLKTTPQDDMINEADAEGKYLTFQVDEQIFGIPISNVNEIISMQEITSVPEYPYHIKGVINLRGQIISVVDVRLRLNKPEIDYNERTCIVVVAIGDNQVGFIVDEVREVMDIAYKDIAERPKMNDGVDNEYLTGFAKIEDNVILIMDTDKILFRSDYAYI